MSVTSQINHWATYMRKDSWYLKILALNSHGTAIAAMNHLLQTISLRTIVERSIACKVYLLLQMWL